MTKTIVAFDPGKITGAAFYVFENKKPVIKTAHFQHFTLVDQYTRNSDIVIYEVPFRLPATDLIVFEVKGAILERAQTLKKEIQPQQATVPAFINAACIDLMKCKKLRGRLIHEKDALCHLAYFLIKTNTYTVTEIGELLQ